jgi:hypothetical protein
MLNILTNHPNFWNKDIIQWLNNSLALTNGWSLTGKGVQYFLHMDFIYLTPIGKICIMIDIVHVKA